MMKPVYETVMTKTGILHGDEASVRNSRQALIPYTVMKPVWESGSSSVALHGDEPSLRDTRHWNAATR